MSEATSGPARPAAAEPQWAEAPVALKRLHEMTTRAITAADRGEALEEILGAAIALSGAARGNIQLYDPEHRVLRLVTQRGFKPQFMEAFQVVGEDDDTACGRALRSRATCSIGDVDRDPAYAPYRALAADAGYRAVQSIPLICRNGDLLGILSIHFRSPRAFSASEVVIAELVARQAADLIWSRQQRDALAHLNQELQQRNTELAARDRNKDAFLVSLGHELRNPLGAISSSLSLVTEADERSRRALSVMRRQSEQLLHLVNDLLDLGRITHGKLELKQRVVDLSDSIRDVAEANRQRIEARELRLELHLPKAAVYVRADPTRLAQVVENLLDNAVRYTEHGRITISARTKGAHAVVSVQDTGAGIDTNEASALFEPYYQSAQPRSDTNCAAGLGFGLALVKRIVELHGGSIEVLSDGPGTGSEFVFSVPLAASIPEECPERPGPESTARRILVVDDNQDNADMFGALLEGLGHEVHVAYEGSTALELARLQRPEVAFLDLSMPGMDGHQLAHRLRDLFPSTDLALVALTGFPRSKQPALANCFEHYLLKPAGIDEVMTILSACRGTEGASAVQD